MSGFGFFHNFLYLVCIHGFYVLGADRLDPIEFRNGDLIDVKAVKISSSFLTRLPYEYYSLPLCAPKNGTVYESENLGKMLMGNRIVNTPYEVRMMENISCRLLCSKKWSLNERNIIVDRIIDNYSVRLLVNDLPGATKSHSSEKCGRVKTKLGYNLGFANGTHVLIYNHLNLIFLYNRVDDQELYRIVGFEVQTASINHDQLTILKDDNNANNCQLLMPDSYIQHPQSIVADGDVPMDVYFTYSVVWKPSNISLASRWDAYMFTSAISDIFSWLIYIYFSGTLIYFNVLWWRNIKRRLADGAIKQPDRILAQKDVFKPPIYPHVFVATIGSGVQIFLMTLVTIFFATLGVISPASEGALIECAIFSYAGVGGLAGFVSARIYKTIGGEQWKIAAFLTAVLYPGLGFSIYFTLNVFMWKEGSSNAVPVSIICSLLIIWLCISLPLVFTGYYIGFKKPPLQILTHQVPKLLPTEESKFICVFIVYCLGVLIGTIQDTIGFSMATEESNSLYRSYSSISLFFFMRAVYCAQQSITGTYLDLCKVRHHWFWRPSFISNTSTGSYMIFLSIMHLIERETFNGVIPTLYYFCYSAMMILPYWLLNFTIGFFPSCFFLKKLCMMRPLSRKEAEIDVIIISSE